MSWKKYWIWKTKFGKTMISSSFQDCRVAVGKFSTLSVPLFVHRIVRNQCE